VTFVLIGFATSRRLGYFFAAFALIIQVGALHPGWHHATDGNVSVLGTWLIWLAASPRDHHAAALGTGARRSRAVRQATSVPAAAE
jgi:hypothetical protein